MGSFKLKMHQNQLSATDQPGSLQHPDAVVG